MSRIRADVPLSLTRIYPRVSATSAVKFVLVPAAGRAGLICVHRWLNVLVPAGGGTPFRGGPHGVDELPHRPRELPFRKARGVRLPRGFDRDPPLAPPLSPRRRRARS